MSLKMIVATGSNFEIGIDDRLLWHLPEDMKYFKEQTINNIVVMGNNTFNSLNNECGLCNRVNYVLTTKQYELPDKIKYSCHETLLCFVNNSDNIKFLKNIRGGREVWIIGGAKVYEEFIDYVDEIHWTHIEKVYQEANKFLTDKTIDKMVKDFDKGTRIKRCYDEKSDTHFTINVLKRIKQSP